MELCAAKLGLIGRARTLHVVLHARSVEGAGLPVAAATVVAQLELTRRHRRAGRLPPRRRRVAIRRERGTHRNRRHSHSASERATFACSLDNRQ